MPTNESRTQYGRLLTVFYSPLQCVLTRVGLRIFQGITRRTTLPVIEYQAKGVSELFFSSSALKQSGSAPQGAHKFNPKGRHVLAGENLLVYKGS